MHDRKTYKAICYMLWNNKKVDMENYYTGCSQKQIFHYSHSENAKIIKVSLLCVNFRVNSRVNFLRKWRPAAQQQPPDLPGPAGQVEEGPAGGPWSSRPRP